MRILAAVLALLLVGACNQRSAFQAPAERREIAGFAGYRASESVPRAIAVRDDSTPSDAAGRFELYESGAMLIREAHVSLRVDSLDGAVRAVNILAHRYGGVVATSAVYTVKSGPTATIMIRVPVARLDSTIAGLSVLGVVESADIKSQDVSEEFVDVTARLENSRRLEHRLLDVLAHRTGGLKDVLQVEQELARVREEIERIEGRRRYLATRAAVSTLEIQVHVPEPEVGPRYAAMFTGAFNQAWTNLLTISAFAISALGAIVPFAVVALPVWLVWRRRQREAVITREAAV